VKYKLLLATLLGLAITGAACYQLAKASPRIHALIGTSGFPSTALELPAGKNFYFLRLSARIVKGLKGKAHLELAGNLPVSLTMVDMHAPVSSLLQVGRKQQVDLIPGKDLDLLVMVRSTGTILGTPAAPLPSCCEPVNTVDGLPRGALVLVEEATERLLWAIPLRVKTNDTIQLEDLFKEGEA